MGEVHPLLAHCTEDVLEFYQKHPDCFSISSIDNLPEDLKWQDGSEEQEFASPNAKKGGTWEVLHARFSSHPQNHRSGCQWSFS